MDLAKLSKVDIENMNYNEVMSIVNETNRPPGGVNTVYNIIKRSCLKEKDKILEIGTNTGFTAIEIAKLVGCQIVGIDINKVSLKEAEIRARKFSVSDKIKFIKADVTNLPFNESEFDLVFCGNVLSIINEKEKALEECRRVLKKYGFLAATPMYYLKEPSKDLIEKISKAIGTEMNVTSKKDWINFYSTADLELVLEEDYKFDFISNEKIKKFVENIFFRNHLKKLSPDVFEYLKEKYLNYLILFRNNLQYVGYSILLYRNTPKEIDPELFTSSPCKQLW